MRSEKLLFGVWFCGVMYIEDTYGELWSDAWAMILYGTANCWGSSFLWSPQNLSSLAVRWKKILNKAVCRPSLVYRTNSLGQSPSWKANSSSVCPENPPYYQTRGYITLFTTSRHLSLFWVRLIQSERTLHVLKIHFNIIFPSMPRCSKLSLTLTFPHQTCMYLSSLPYTSHAPHIWFFLIWSPD